MLFICLLPLSVFAQNTLMESIMHDGKQRDYTLYFPASYAQSSEDYALVFNFHGFTSNGAQQRLYSEMDKVADTAQVIMCYPEGIDNAWNVGWNFGSMEDDVGFTSAMIDKFLSDHRVDPNKVYACGMSNGGFFSYKLACELSSKIAAVASVTGSIVPGQDEQCMPGKAVPTLEIHGTADPIVPYDGSTGVAMPIEDVVAFWVENNGCASNAELVDIPNTSTTDASTAQVQIYNDCTNETEVHFIRIEDGGHTWPGAPIVIGVTNQDFHASQYIWEFFSKFSLSETVSNVQEPGSVLDAVTLYPNPSNGNITLSNLPVKSEIELFHMDGRFILNRTSASPEESFILNRGVYIFRVRHNKATNQFFTIVE